MRKRMSILIGLVAAVMAITPTAAYAATDTTTHWTATTANLRPSVPEQGLSAEADETTGDYEYNCVADDGSSYFMSDGEVLTDCKGSFLQKYLDGNMLESVELSYGGGAVSSAPSASDGCIVAYASGAGLIFFPPADAFTWVTNGAMAAAGITFGCVSF
ncbi:conserved exported protein of unknown function [Agreia sp. COWG]|nr:conserved exported protein of unknown function [Agreia sp. COWG]